MIGSISSFAHTMPPWIVLGFGMVVGYVKSAWSWVYGHTIGYAVRKCTVRITIEEDEHAEAYGWLMVWAEQRLRARRVTDVMLRRKRHIRDDLATPQGSGDDDSSYELIPHYGTYYMLWRNRYPLVFASAKESQNGSPDSGRSYSRPRRTTTVTLWGTLNRNFLLNILDEARREFDVQHPKQLYYYTNSLWGDSWSQKLMQRRDINTLYLPQEMLHDIVSSFERFFASKSRYRKLGIPWRTGFLFFGPPGTGKSTLVQVLSSLFSIPIYYLSLNGISSPQQLMSAFSSPEGPCIILIEDADCIEAAISRQADAKDKGFGMNDLLNAIDGLVAAEGRILILTTNYRDKLDGALLRAGRLDREFFIDYAGNEELRRFHGMASLYYDIPQWREFSDKLGIYIH